VIARTRRPALVAEARSRLIDGINTVVSASCWDSSTTSYAQVLLQQAYREELDWSAIEPLERRLHFTHPGAGTIITRRGERPFT
jgi:hypothetical protein